MKLKLILLIVISFLVFSYKLASVPNGLTIDEASFGYNAVLLSKTYHDENNRFLPIFVLSIDKNDWRQPITQYFMATFFKLFGPSTFNLRFTSVVVASLSVAMMFLISGFWGSIFLLTTPIFFMHSHLGLDNIMPVPFIIIWLYGLYKYSNSNKNIWLVLAGIIIGLGFYSYKGVRIFIPVWFLTSLVFIFLQNKKIKPLLYYIFSFAPFMLIIPFLEKYYAGAVLNNEKLKFEGVYTFLYRYFSAFDLSFLYIKGDEMLIHSTGMHGMLLLATMPIFLLGLVKLWQSNLFGKFVVSSFVLGPFLFGFIGAVHRASRMISEVPFYVIICGYGMLLLSKKYKYLYFLAIVLVFINFVDFAKYYHFEYPQKNANIFYSLDAGEEYKYLKEISDMSNLTPFVDDKFLNNKFSSGDFIRSIYFINKPNSFSGDVNSLPKNSVLMTDNPNITSLTKSDIRFKNYIYYIKH